MDVSLNNREKEILREIGQVADQLNYEAYVIGGFVRDKILELECKDIDIVCLGSGIDFAKAVSKSLKSKPSVSYFKNFGTAMLKLDDYEIEFVGARKESYRRDSRKPIVEDGTLDDDQNRRDFTINALAMQLNGNCFGKLLDPFNGVEDLSKGIIRTPLNPDQTFSDDPLRILRGIRFASRFGFGIEEQTLQAMERNAHRLEIVSQERITDELNKMILGRKPSAGFKLMFNTKVLNQIFPLMTKLHGVEKVGKHAHKDNFYHTLQVLDNLCQSSDNLWLRWSAILHDIAKPATKRYEAGTGWTFHGHEAVGAKWIPRIFKKFKLPLDKNMKYVQKMVMLHLRPISLTKDNITDSAIRRLIFDAGDDLEDLLKLCHADITSKNDHKVKRYKKNLELVKQRIEEVEARDHIRNWQPPITGELIMKTFGIKPSREVGVIKNNIKEAILEGEINNEYDEAFNFMLKEGARLGLTKVN